MPCHLLIRGVNQVKGTMNQVLPGPIHIHPDGKENGAQMSGAHLGNTDHIGTGGVREVVVFIQQELRRVSVGVNDDGVIENPGSNGAKVRRRLGKGPRQGGLPCANQHQRADYRTYFQSSKRHIHRSL